MDYSPSELKSIYIAALDHEPGEPREKFLLEACGENAALRRRIESLLAARERADKLLGADISSGPEMMSFNPDEIPPERIDRYRIERLLGQGGFGLVYLAYDEQLNRRVAIKLPHRQLVARDDAAEAYLTEARAVAGLNHPHIVPVYDVGSTDEFPCYIVSKYIDGIDLATRLKQSRLSILESAELVATVAEALHHAHQQGLVHRDVKPGNLLLDHDGIPFLADFGVALREENIGTGPRYAGTPTYMSPEQARGEGHRVDGRSDLFSLGVVFYELLVGKRPFSGKSTYELMENITSFEPRPPRQYDDRIPKELDRICLKALSKRASERYSTAKDMADELRQFLGSVAGDEWKVTGVEGDARSQRTPPTALLSSPNTPHTSPATFHPSQSTLKVVPKGLRSFDAHDADFFLELLPGPRDRDGLPDSIRFWKSRIEETEADNTFSVGLIYGPSGCGKSSLVKAGLLPRLSNHVITVYLEATAEETELRLLNGLRNRCPALPDHLSLKETLAALRQGQGIPVGKKVLIVLDQFEQWLHAKKEDEHTELVESLRQCDAKRVQCIVMVRDDFWMAATRFMRELEVRLLEAQNSAAVDLFPIRHAEKVLGTFGQAFCAFPDGSTGESKEAKEFLKHAVSGLAQEGKVICVRLALFAEMMKGKAWTKAGLREVGGTEGIGVTFLEETFSATTARPERRRHQQAVRAVLKGLLPELGTDIKGHSHSYAELLEDSGYTNRPEDFENLIRILDSELRLITPSDGEGKDEGGRMKDEEDASTRDSSSSFIPHPSSFRFFQLTHDYLVPSLREWLTRKQKETPRGRAELLLADRAAIWNARPENRQLPSVLQWFNIWWLTQKKNWTPSQKKMMAKGARVHAMRGTIAALLLMGLGLAGVSIRRTVLAERSRNEAQIQQKENTTRAEGLVASLLSADIAQVPTIISNLKAYREWTDPLLKARLAEATDGSPEKLAAALGLLPVDDDQINYLKEQLPVCNLEQFPVVRKALISHKDALIEGLWHVLQDEHTEPRQKFQVSAALAEYSPDDERWQQLAPFVARYLTSAVPSVSLGQWRQLFLPGNKQLTGPLIASHADRTRPETQRENAAFVLSYFLKDQPAKLCDVILVADELREYAPLFEAIKPHAASVIQSLLTEIRATMPVHLAKSNDELPEADQPFRDAHWKRQSLAAVTLVHLGYPDELWSLLKFSPDPSLRSFIINHLGKLGTNHDTLAARLEIETDVSIRRALIQSLGGFDSTLIPSADYSRIAKQLKALYVDDNDSGTHGSASWTLRKWGVALAELLAGESVLTELLIAAERDATSNGVRQWYVNGQGQTMVVIPTNALVGQNKIATGFAISSHEVTVAEFRRFRAGHRVDNFTSPTVDAPVNAVIWFDAAEYCNWLSQQEGIPEEQWIYLPNDEGKYADGMKFKEQWSELSGYRMPTVNEWIFACRSGTSGTYHFGEPVPLLKNYGLYAGNFSGHSIPVGSLLPNEFGIFDMHGNISECTQDSESGPWSPVYVNIKRAYYGGSFFGPPPYVRSEHHVSFPPTFFSFNFGIRIARTLPLKPGSTLPPAP